jgi:hypothetical protein
VGRPASAFSAGVQLWGAGAGRTSTACSSIVVSAGASGELGGAPQLPSATPSLTHSAFHRKGVPSSLGGRLAWTFMCVDTRKFEWGSLQLESKGGGHSGLSEGPGKEHRHHPQGDTSDAEPLHVTVHVAGKKGVFGGVLGSSGLQMRIPETSETPFTRDAGPAWAL